MAGMGIKPPNPFKFKWRWILDEDYVKLVKDTYIYYDGYRRESVYIQFDTTIQHVKQTSLASSRVKKIRDTM